MRTNQQISQLDENLRNPSRTKIPRTCIKLSKSKDPRSPMKQHNSTYSNIKSVNITLNAPAFTCRQNSIHVLQKCKNQLTKKNKILIKKIQEKQQKIEQLRDTYRNIQRSKSKEIEKSKQKVKQKIIVKAHKKDDSYQNTPQTKISSTLSSSEFMSKLKLFSPIT